MLLTLKCVYFLKINEKQKLKFQRKTTNKHKNKKFFFLINQSFFLFFIYQSLIRCSPFSELFSLYYFAHILEILFLIFPIRLNFFLFFHIFNTNINKLG
jgi:hypothetical protein